MTRRAPRLDGNQTDIVLGLIAEGWSVQSLAGEGCGCPDILVGAGGVNVLLEIKDPNQPPSARKLTPDQRKWHAGWRGQVHVIETLEQAKVVVLEEIARRWPGGEDA